MMRLFDSYGEVIWYHLYIETNILSNPDLWAPFY